MRYFFFFSSRRRHTRWPRDWSSDVCSSDLELGVVYDQPDAVLDQEARESDARALDRRWSAVLAEARGRDRTIVWLRATPIALQWLPRATKHIEGVDLVP